MLINAKVSPFDVVNKTRAIGYSGLGVSFCLKVLESLQG